MKRIERFSALMAGICLFLASHTQAVDYSVGFKAGVGLSTLRGSFIEAYENYLGTSYDDQMRLGLYLNGSFGIHFSEYVTMQMEMAYAMKGKEYYNEDFDSDVEMRLSYIEFPFIFRFDIPINRHVHTMLYTGPQISFLASSELYSTVPVPSFAYDFEEYTKPVELGMVFGGGVHFRLSQGIWLFQELRFMPGLTNVYESDIWDLDINTMTYVFMMGLNFIF